MALATTHVLHDPANPVALSPSEISRQTSDVSPFGLHRTVIVHDEGDAPPVGTEVARQTFVQTAEQSNQVAIRQAAEALIDQIEDGVTYYRDPARTAAERQTFVVNSYDDVLVALSKVIRLSAGLYGAQGPS